MLAEYVLLDILLLFLYLLLLKTLSLGLIAKEHRFEVTGSIAEYVLSTGGNTDICILQIV